MSTATVTADARQRLNALRQRDADHARQLWQVSVHEAGHSIVAMLIGASVVGADILREDDRLGTCWSYPPPQDAKQLALYVAGPLAEVMFAGGDGYTRSSWGSDCKQAAEILANRGIRRGAHSRLWQDAMRDARSMLQQHEAAVLNVARRLMIYEVLNGATIAHALELESQGRL
jgi:ATP-dependent Zn protease